MHTPKPRSGERGIALIMALLILLLLSLLSGALLMSSFIDTRIAQAYEASTQLLYIAEAGIEDGRDLLRLNPVGPSTIPFIERKALVDSSGREAGRYSVFLTRDNPLTLQSVGMRGLARRTVETRLIKSGFPLLPQAAVTLAETLIIPPGADPPLPSLKEPLGLERLITGISRNATEIYRPEFPTATILSRVGSPVDYPVVVVDGDCTFSDATGFGLLLVRGHLTLGGSFAWRGLVLVIGQGALHVADGSIGWIEGGLFIARTRNNDRTSGNALGSLAGSLGLSTLDLGDSDVNVSHSAEEWVRANAVFPYVPISYREF